MPSPPERPFPSLAEQVADLAVIHDPDGMALERLSNRSRGTGWEKVERHAGWLVAADPTPTGQAGYRCVSYELADHDVILLGRLNRRAHEPGDLARILARSTPDDTASHAAGGTSGQAAYGASGGTSGQATGGPSGSSAGDTSSGIDDRTAGGSWLMLARHRNRGQWSVTTDRFATISAYRHTARGAVATNAAAIGANSPIDYRALLSLCAQGFLPGDRTHYQTTRAIRPARHVTIPPNGGNGADDGYRWWNWPPSAESGDQLSHDEALEAVNELLRTIIAEQMPAPDEGPLAVPVSGGLDSRTILAQLLASGVDRDRLRCFSYGYGPDSIETRIARQACEVVGQPIDTWEIPATLFDHIEDTVADLDAQVDPTQPRQSGVLERISHHGSRLTAAHWGDVWFDTLGLADARPDLPNRALVNHALSRLHKPGAELLTPLFRPHLDGEDPASILADSVAEECEPVADLGHPDWRMTALKTDWWSFRSTVVGVSVYRRRIEPVMPFYDARMATLMARIPRSSLTGRRLQIDHLLRLEPRMGSVTWQSTELPLRMAGTTRGAAAARTAVLPYRAGRAAMRRVRPTRRTLRNWEVQFAGPKGAAGIHRWLERDGLRIHDEFGRDRVVGLVHRFQAQRGPAEGYAVASLLNLSVWLEQLA